MPASSIVSKFALNDQQQLAISRLQGPLLVISGPGSGKTRVITARTAALLKSGISPHQILVLTFTKAAAREMKERLAELPFLQEQQVRPLSMSTFHSLCYQILRVHNGHPPRIVSERQRRRWVEQSLLQQQEEIKDDLVEEMLQTISYNKNSCLDYSDIRRHKALAARVWADYETAKTAAGLFDYDDLLLNTYKLLQQFPDRLHSLRKRWQHIMVDEFQDTNLVQYRLLQLLAAPANNLCVVGDIDQAIYSWRAADPKLLLQFEQDFPGAKRVQLVQNYRSLPPIINLANRLIKQNKLRHPIAVEPVRKGKIAPRLLRPSDEWAEAKAVLTMLEKWQTGTTPLNELAVLYRVNSQARPLASLLVEADIPFVVHERGQLGLEHWVIEECHAFLRLLADPNDLESFLRVSRRQLRLNAEGNEYLRRLAASRQLTPYAAYRQLPVRYTDLGRLGQLQSHLAKARKLLPSEALNYYLKRMGFASYLEWYAKRRGYPENQFLDICDDLLSDLRRFITVASYLDHLNELLAAMARPVGEQELPAVNLMTLHGAKGLEFKAVWILGVIDSLLPHSLSKSPEQLEEERRLLYVGCTRAKDYLYLLAPNYYHGQPAKESSFLAEAFGQEFKPPQKQPLVPTSGAQKNSGGKATTAEQAAQGMELQPPPAAGQILQHKDLGLGKIITCTKEKARGQNFHVLTIDFPTRAGFKLHWELSQQMGFVVVQRPSTVK